MMEVNSTQESYSHLDSYQLKCIYKAVYNQIPNSTWSKDDIINHLVQNKNAHQFYTRNMVNIIDKSPVFSLMGGKIDHNLPMLVEWNHHPTDDSLYYFYRSIEADYSTLDQAKTQIEQIFLAILYKFQLIPKGSYAHKIALKNHSDLDLDLVLPRSYLSQEDMELMCIENNNSNGEKQFNPFQYICQGLQDHLSKNKTDTFEIVNAGDVHHHPTRSIKMKVKIGFKLEIEADIFPKVIDKHGNICFFGHKDKNGNRGWIKTPLSRSTKKIELSEEEKATILLLKLWKKDSSKYLKGYLIAIAVERVVHEASSTKNDQKKDQIVFCRETIRKNMIMVAQYLVSAFQSKVNDPQFNFENESDNPFKGETDEKYHEGIITSLLTLIKELNQSK